MAVNEDCYPYNIRELVMFEFQRAYFYQPFNRYAWALARPRPKWVLLLQRSDPSAWIYARLRREALVGGL